MARFVQAVINGFDIDGAAFKVEIIGPGAVVDVVELQAGYPLAVVKWQRDESAIFTSTMMQSECEINFIDTGNADAIINMLAGAADNTISVRVVYTGTPDVLFWCGIIMPDTLTVELSKNPKNVNIRATDGFSVLQEYTAHKGVATIHEFGKVFYPIISQLICYTDNFLSSAQSVFFQPNFEVTGASNQVFKDVIFEREFDNDYEYLNAVLNDMGLYLVHTDGYYYMISVFSIATGSFSGTWYKEASITPIASTTLSYSTITSKTDVGGLRRWARPFGDVALSFSNGTETNDFIASEVHGTAVVDDQITVLNYKVGTSFIGVLDCDISINSERDPAASSDTVRCFAKIKYGNKWYTNKNTWSTTDQPYFYEDMTKYTGSGSYGQIAFYQKKFTIDFAASGIGDNEIFKIDIYVSAVSSGSAARLKYLESQIYLSTQAQEEQTYTTGATLPQLQKEYFFGDDNILNTSGLISTDLADNVQDLWTDGTLTDYLHVIRASALKDATADPSEILEATIDNLVGPASFYNVATHKCMPLSLEMDMARKEGAIVGFKVGTIA